MPRSSCDVCCKAPQMFRGRDQFESSVGIVLCDMLAALNSIAPGGVGTRYDYTLLCDEGSVSGNAPVLLRVEYQTDGVIVGFVGFNPDGTLWAGDLADLASCECACLTTNVLAINVQEQSGNLVTSAIDAVSEDVTFNFASFGARTIEIEGTWDGTIEFQASFDGTNWYTVTLQKPDGTAVINTTVNGLFYAPQGVGTWIRAFSTAWSSGSATVSIIGYLVDNSNKVLASPVSRPTTRYRNLALSTTGAVIKASPGSIHFLHMANPDADDAAYVKLYNQTDAPDSTDTPVETYFVPANSPHGFVLPIDLSAFSTGIGIRASQGSADNDNVAPSTALIINARYS